MRKLLASLVLLTSTLVFAQGNDVPAIDVKVFTVNSDAVKITKNYPATIKAQKSVDIIARVSGSLENRYFEEGSFVTKGQNLYKIEQTTYQSNIDSARALVSSAESLLVKTTSDWKRYKKLFEEKSISASVKDEYYYNYQDAIANKKNADASLKNAEIEYAYTKIQAPISGIISITKLNVGNYINANTTLTTITQVNPIYAEFSLPQSDISKYLSHIKSNEVKFSINCQVECIGDGILKYVSPTLDSSTDTLLLRAEFNNKDSHVIIGQFTNITIDNITIPGVISIPEVAIVQSGSDSVVYVIDDESKVQTRSVTLTGENTSTGVIISSGLKNGEKIVLSNISKLKPNSKVQIIEGKK